MMDEKETEFIASIIVNAFLVTPLTLIALLPIWFAIFGNWGAYLFWIPITIPLSRVCDGILMLLCPLMAIVKVKYSYIISAIQFAILAIWGLPVFRIALTNMVSTPLTGLDLQKTILQIIIIEGLSISAALSLRTTELKE